MIAHLLRKRATSNRDNSWVLSPTSAMATATVEARNGEALKVVISNIKTIPGDDEHKITPQHRPATVSLSQVSSIPMTGRLHHELEAQLC